MLFDFALQPQVEFIDAEGEHVHVRGIVHGIPGVTMTVGQEFDATTWDKMVHHRDGKGAAVSAFCLLMYWFGYVSSPLWGVGEVEKINSVYVGLTGVLMFILTILGVGMLWVCGYGVRMMLLAARKRCHKATHPSTWEWLNRVYSSDKDEILARILGDRKRLPTLIGVHPKLDEYIKEWLASGDTK